MIVIDVFSKWIELFPMKTKSADEVWNVMYDQIFTRFGLPVEIRSDRGREFAGIMITKCKEYGVRLIKTSVQNP